MNFLAGRWVISATRVGLLVPLLSGGFASTIRPRGADPKILVSAASSLTDVMREIASEFQKAHPRVTVKFNFGASGTLEKQIEQGAPVDVFASAGEKEMDDLKRAGQVVAGSRVVFTTNRLALIAPLNSKIRAWADLVSPSVRRIALPRPELVPSGRYGKDTLSHRKLWAGVQPKLVLAQNVRQALTYVTSGDVDAGIVFVTDAEAERSRIRVVSIAQPRFDHPLITYPAATVRNSRDLPDASAFVEFLRSPKAQVIFRAHGFGPNL